MTEETAAPAVVEETPVEPVVEPVVEERAAPLSKHEARQQMREARQTTVDTTEVVEEPAEGAEEPIEAAPEATEEAPAITAETEPTEKAPVEPETSPRIRIDIPSDHPLHGMGHDHIDVDPAQERVFRAAINGYVRRQEVADADAKIADLQEKLARRDASEAALRKVQGTEAYRVAEETYNEIKETMGQEKASQFWKSVQVDLQVAEDQEYKQRMDALHLERAEEMGRRWATDEWARTSYFKPEVRNHPQFRQVFDESIDSFNKEIEIGHYADLGRLPEHERPEAVHKAFTSFLQSRILREPALVAAYKKVETPKGPAVDTAGEAQRTREAMKREIREELLKEMAEKREGTPPHPLGTLSAAPRERVPVVEGDEPSSPKSAHELRKQSRNAARADARRHFQR